jgi:TonB family protein
LKSKLQNIFDATYDLSGPTIDVLNVQNVVESPDVGNFPKLKVVEPFCSITGASLRFGVFEPKPPKYFLTSSVAVFLHLSFVCIVLFFGNLGTSPLLVDTVQPMEIAWGLDVDSSGIASEAPSELGTLEQENEATKDKQLLPQLPKLIDVETQTPETMSEIPNPESVEVPKEVLKEIEKKTVDKKDAPVIAKEERNVKKLTSEELQKRKEKEKRKEDVKTKEGVKDKSISDGKKSLPNDLPPAPSFAANGKGGAGNKVDGSKISVGDPNSTTQISGPDEEFQAVLKNHVLRNWNIASVSDYDESLSVKISIVLNSFGRLVKPPIVFKSSGNEEFDLEALAAVKSSEPFPEPSDGSRLKRLILNLQPSQGQRNE